MFTKEGCIFTMIMIGQSIIGILGNGYIALMCWIDCLKKNKTSSLNYILTSLAISRVCLIFTMVVGDLLTELYPDYFGDVKLVLLLSAFWILVNFSSLWFATCLNIFYLLKVANFSCSLFLWLKWRIDRVIYWILLACLAISSLSCLLIAIPNYYEETYRFTKLQKRNISEKYLLSKIEFFNLSTLANLLTIIPLTVSLISFFLLILSLSRHTKQMKLSATGWRDPSTEAHITAMRNVTSFLFLLFVYCVACLLLTYRYLIKEERLVLGLGMITGNLYPSVHSLILIIGNSKLRQTPVRILRYGREKMGCLM